MTATPFPTTEAAAAAATGALDRAAAILATGPARWQPVFADIIKEGRKIGHIVSDGYHNKKWAFVPVDESRRYRRQIAIDLEAPDPFANLVPSWARPFAFGPFRTLAEIQAATAASPIEEMRKHRAAIADASLRSIHRATGAWPSHDEAAALATTFSKCARAAGDGIEWRHAFAIALADLSGVEDAA